MDARRPKASAHTLSHEEDLESGFLQNLKALGIGLHEAILDAVVNHLDEMSSACRTAV